ncbi:unnamed protein product [Closterium sp. Naga37s-1]|nr:unnamed protein product [Closterium sp. Naga37s-1]
MAAPWSHGKQCAFSEGEGFRGELTSRIGGERFSAAEGLAVHASSARGNELGGKAEGGTVRGEGELWGTGRSETEWFEGGGMEGERVRVPAGENTIGSYGACATVAGGAAAAAAAVPEPRTTAAASAAAAGAAVQAPAQAGKAELLLLENASLLSLIEQQQQSIAALRQAAAKAEREKRSLCDEVGILREALDASTEHVERLEERVACMGGEEEGGGEGEGEGGEGGEGERQGERVGEGEAINPFNFQPHRPPPPPLKRPSPSPLAFLSRDTLVHRESGSHFKASLLPFQCAPAPAPTPTPPPAPHLPSAAAAGAEPSRGIPGSVAWGNRVMYGAPPAGLSTILPSSLPSATPIAPASQRASAATAAHRLSSAMPIPSSHNSAKRDGTWYQIEQPQKANTYSSRVPGFSSFNSREFVSAMSSRQSASNSYSGPGGWECARSQYADESRLGGVNRLESGGGFDRFLGSAASAAAASLRSPPATRRGAVGGGYGRGWQVEGGEGSGSLGSGFGPNQFTSIDLQLLLVPVCDFYFYNFKGETPVITINAVAVEKVASTALRHESDKPVQTATTSGPFCKVIGGGSCDNYFFFRARGASDAYTKFVNRNDRLGIRPMPRAKINELNGKCIKLYIETAKIKLGKGVNASVWLNPNDNNPGYPQTHRCVVFKVAAGS